MPKDSNGGGLEDTNEAQAGAQAVWLCPYCGTKEELRAYDGEVERVRKGCEEVGGCRKESSRFRTGPIWECLEDFIT